VQVLPPFGKPADHVRPSTNPTSSRKWAGAHSRGRPLGENGYAEKTYEEVDQLAERSQPSPEEEAGEHHDEGLKGQGM